MRSLLLVCLLSLLPASLLADDLALVQAARSQVGRTVLYDPAYRKLEYPGGDVPADRGVCTDVVIRALRVSHALDLQRLVHEDMRREFKAYPKLWGLKAPDANIDHRRVPNLQTYFDRQGWKRPRSDDKNAYLPGDIVTCLVAGNRPHIVIVSNRRDASGAPLIIHNIGSGTREEPGLFSFTITGHYRPPARPAAR